MDVHRVNCENLDMNAWSKQILEIKIRELREAIVKKQEECKVAIANGDMRNVSITESINLLAISMGHGCDLIKLELKYDILTRKLARW
jgi:hypothetical protein